MHPKIWLLYLVLPGPLDETTPEMSQIHIEQLPVLTTPLMCEEL